MIQFNFIWMFSQFYDVQMCRDLYLLNIDLCAYTCVHLSVCMRNRVFISVCAYKIFISCFMCLRCFSFRISFLYLLRRDFFYAYFNEIYFQLSVVFNRNGMQ